MTSGGGISDMSDRVADEVYTKAQEPPFERDPQGSAEQAHAWILALDDAPDDGTLTFHYKGDDLVADASGGSLTAEIIQSALRQHIELLLVSVADTGSNTFHIQNPYSIGDSDILGVTSALTKAAAPVAATSTYTLGRRQMTRITPQADFSATMATRTVAVGNGTRDVTIRMSPDAIPPCACYCCDNLDATYTTPATAAEVGTAMLTAANNSSQLRAEVTDDGELIFVGQTVGTGTSHDGCDNNPATETGFTVSTQVDGRSP